MEPGEMFKAIAEYCGASSFIQLVLVVCGCVWLGITFALIYGK